ncbi:hypothetical protein PG999_013778 [Apiospora kogelbergensis]|uniref:Myb-like domain-containing protein n=1 Tax=Apiospora kogelbergensis TaxID=1337665 RepID=A0AAW0Q709_9PEZI
MLAHRDTPRYHQQTQSADTIRGRFKRLITHDQSRRAGLLWDSPPSPPDLLRARDFDDSDRYNDNGSNYYQQLSDIAASRGGPSIAARAGLPPLPPPLSKLPKNEPEGFPSFFWTAEEDRQLLELRDQSKLDWEEIADRLMGQRSASACCSRYNRTLFNKQLEKMASKCRNNSGEQLPAVAEEREEEIYQGVPASLPPETSPHSPHPQTPMVISPTSSSLPGSREPLQDYHWLSTLSMDKEGDDQSFYQAQPPPLEPLEPSVADTCSEVLMKARFCLSLNL